MFDPSIILVTLLGYNYKVATVSLYPYYSDKFTDKNAYRELCKKIMFDCFHPPPSP